MHTDAQPTAMRTIGLIAGMSWESSIEYYRLLNTLVQQRLGGLHSAKCILFSVDFAEIEVYQREDDWAGAARQLGEAAQALERAGAECILLCTNTMHRVAGEIRAAVSIPLLHIAEPAVEAVRADGHVRAGLLGTRYTMEQDFYRTELERGGLEVLIPGDTERGLVHRIIYEELCQGIILPESREAFLQIIRGLADAGAEAIILGCTEISLLIRQEDSPLPLYDTAYLHVQRAVQFALESPRDRD